MMVVAMSTVLVIASVVEPATVASVAYPRTCVLILLKAHQGYRHSVSVSTVRGKWKWKEALSRFWVQTQFIGHHPV